MMRNESKIYGQHACLALFKQRPESIERVFLLEERRGLFRDVLRVCADRHRPYRIVPSEELEKISGTRHHEGICFVVTESIPRPLAEIVAEPGSQLVVALDGIGNPHNIGTLLRSAAHFGASAVLIGGEQKRLSAAAYRTAEGAAEYLEVLCMSSLFHALRQCRDSGFTICGTSSHEGDELFAAPLPTRMVLLLGAERDGLSADLLHDADRVLQIPGSGRVESLNVSSSAAVMMAEYWRCKTDCP